MPNNVIKQIKCTSCKKKFSQRRKNQVFCSDKCRFAHWAKSHPRVAIERIAS